VGGIYDGSKECPIVMEEDDPQKYSHLIGTIAQHSGKGALLGRGSILGGFSLLPKLGHA
jgi:hypothetical protein